MCAIRPCVIRRNTKTKDGRGTESVTPTVIATVLAGLAEPTAGQLQNFDYEVGDLATWQVKLPIGTSIQVQDELTIAGQVLEVHVVLTPRSYATLLTVLACEIK